MTVAIGVGIVKGELPVLDQAQSACSTCQTLQLHLAAVLAVLTV
jgi:hypothetical protein